MCLCRNCNLNNDIMNNNKSHYNFIIIMYYPFCYTNFGFFFDSALVVTRRWRPRQQKVAQVSVTSCWRLADQGRKNELLGDSCWPAYGLSHTDDPLRHCPMHYATLLFFSFFFFFFKVHIKRTSKAAPPCGQTSEN